MPLSDYHLYIRYEVHQTLRAIRPHGRQQILNMIESLSSDPFQEAHYSETDASARPVQVTIVGKFAVYYQVDHASKEVRVIDLVDADR